MHSEMTKKVIGLISFFEVVTATRREADTVKRDRRIAALQKDQETASRSTNCRGGGCFIRSDHDFARARF